MNKEEEMHYFSRWMFYEVNEHRYLEADYLILVLTYYEMWGWP